MIKDIVIILFIILLIALIAFYYINALKKDIVEEEYTPMYSLPHLMDVVTEAFQEMLKENLKELNLSKEELESERRKKHELRTSIHDASYGDKAAKRYVKDAIKTVLQDDAVGISKSTINSAIPFNDPDSLTIRQKADIVLHVFTSKYKEYGFEEMMLKYGLNKPKNVSVLDESKGKLKYVITKEEMEDIYEDVMSTHSLTYDDKLEILTQYIFAQVYGLGAIDNLLDQSIDEIQGGTGGVAKGNIEIKREDMGPDFEYSYEHIKVMYKGIVYKLSYLSFESDEELTRITKNIYKYDTPHALTQSESHVTAMMKDGSRVSVSCPPETPSYTFWVRKYDSVSKAPTLDELFKNQGNIEILKTLVKHLMHTQRSIVISGPMGSGKSTTLKSSIGYLPSSKSIRILEGKHELNIEAAFPQRNIVSFAVTESTDMQMIYDFIKKTTSNINIVGEAASAIEGVIALQSTQVGSEQAILTNHANTTEDFITEFSDYLMTKGGYTDKKSAEQVVVQGFNFDIHLSTYHDMRYVERITEIVPVRDNRFPSEKEDLTPGGSEDTREYYKRTTDGKSYKCVNIMEFSLIDNSYHMKNMISDDLLRVMEARLGNKEREEFVNDFRILETLIGK